MVLIKMRETAEQFLNKKVGCVTESLLTVLPNATRSDTPSSPSLPISTMPNVRPPRTLDRSLVSMFCG